MKSQTKQTMIWGAMLIILGIVLLVEAYTDLNTWIWVSLLVLGGLAAFIIYLMDRSEMALLLLTYVLWAVAGLITFVTLNILQDEIVATYVLTIIAIPFLVAFLRNRTQWGLLIPAYILLAVGIMVALIGADILDDLLIPAYVMLAIAIPFFAVFIRDTKKWWALIPGGILAIIGLSFLFVEAAVEYVLAAALIVAGVLILVRQFIRPGPKPPDQTSEPPSGQQALE